MPSAPRPPKAGASRPSTALNPKGRNLEVLCMTEPNASFCCKRNLTRRATRARIPRQKRTLGGRPLFKFLLGTRGLKAPSCQSKAQKEARPNERSHGILPLEGIIQVLLAHVRILLREGIEAQDLTQSPGRSSAGHGRLLGTTLAATLKAYLADTPPENGQLQQKKHQNLRSSLDRNSFEATVLVKHLVWSSGLPNPNACHTNASGNQADVEPIGRRPPRAPKKMQILYTPETPTSIRPGNS